MVGGTMSAHTPGPWFVTSSGQPHDLVTSTHDSDGLDDDVCEVYGGNDDSDEVRAANAHLIAAAPELLAALKDAEALLNHGDFSNGNTHPDRYGPDEGSVLAGRLVGRRIRAAIAKAEGKS